jgi:hypothetical protein
MLSTRNALLLTLALALTLLVALFYPLLISPGHYFFSMGGDGVKNYYNLMYYVKFDQGTHFSGMNYPYGEQIIFTDGQPLIAWIMRFMQHHGINASDRIPALLNLAMLCSPLISALFLLLIMRHFGFRHWTAACYAVLIAMMSPQVLRCMGHYALVYQCFPIIWYLLIKSFSTKKRLVFVALLSMVLLAFGFLHMYHFMMNFLFIMAVCSFYFLLNNKRAAFLRLMPIVFSAVLPLIILLAFNKLTDHVTDRPTTPWGFFHYCTSPFGLFFPSDNRWLLNTLAKFHFNTAVDFEGKIYVGVIAGLVIISMLILVARNFLRKSGRTEMAAAMQSAEGAVILASLALLMFAMALPFKWHLQWLLDVVTSIKQFRSPGRFAWVFYYVFCTYAAIALYHFYCKFIADKNVIIKTIFLLTPIAIWSFEMLHQVHKVSESISNNVAADFLQARYEKMLQQHQLKSNDFQALVPAPYFYVGSEKIGSDRYDVLVDACHVSYETGLPMTTGALSRTGIGQALNCASLISDPLLPKAVLKDYPDQRPLLLICNMRRLNSDEQYYCNKAIFIDSVDGLSYFSLPLSAFEFNRDSLLNDTKANATLRDGAFKKYYSPDTLSPYYFFQFPGEGIMCRGKFNLFNALLKQEKAGEKLHFSFWIKVDPHTEAMPVLCYRQYTKDGVGVDGNDFSCGATNDAYKGWVKVSFSFELKSKGNRVEIFTEGNTYQLSHCLLYPDGTSQLIYDNKYDSWYFNNIPIAANKH